MPFAVVLVPLPIFGRCSTSSLQPHWGGTSSGSIVSMSKGGRGGGGKESKICRMVRFIMDFRLAGFAMVHNAAFRMFSQSIAVNS